MSPSVRGGMKATHERQNTGLDMASLSLRQVNETLQKAEA